MCHRFRKSEIRSFDIEIPLDDLEIWRYLSQEIVGFFISEIAQTEDLTDFPWGEEFLELEFFDISVCFEGIR